MYHIAQILRQTIVQPLYVQQGSLAQDLERLVGDGRMGCVQAQRGDGPGRGRNPRRAGFILVVAPRIRAAVRPCRAEVA
jgi:hypothetical protein